MNIYVSNIPFTLSEMELKNVFTRYGEVLSVKIIKDKQTGRSRGFGFVEMENEEEGLEAVEKLNGAELNGRELKVKQAYPREEQDR
ncbi:MAG TPA: RNA-binding protein [Microscillaceae bacterium]|nr:RNA-binding protein [Microscillaceae bacterium]